MKVKGQQCQIHALIGKCHLHNKKKSLYSICLKLGTKSTATTEYKLPINDQINFNTQLILKVDKEQFDPLKKVTLIVMMQSEDRERKIVGSLFVNFREKGLQVVKVCQCSCKDRSYEVSVEFQVVDIQNHINNHPNFNNNNNFQTPNNSQMKDLKKALTISREKQLIKSSRVIKQPININRSPGQQKTAPKLNKQKVEKQLVKDHMVHSNDLSSLTTRISPSSVNNNNNKLAQESMQQIAELRAKISQLENTIQQSSLSQKSAHKSITTLKQQLNTLKQENQCLLEILTLEEEKSSAAIQYILFLSQKISQKNLIDQQFHRCLEMVEDIKNISLFGGGGYGLRQKNYQRQQKMMVEGNYSMIGDEQHLPYNNKQNGDRISLQIEEYQATISELKLRIEEFQNESIQKNNTISILTSQITTIQKQNTSLKSDIHLTKQQINHSQSQINSLTQQNSSLHQKVTHLQQNILSLNTRLSQSDIKIQQLSTQYTNCLSENHKLQTALSKLSNLQKELDNLVIKNQQLFIENRQLKNKQRYKTPTESQIVVRKSRFQDDCEEEIQNIIGQINESSENIRAKDILVDSQKDDRQDHQRFLSHSKSQSLLKDLQQSESSHKHQSKPSQQPHSIPHSQNTTTKKITIPQHKKQVQKYNYNYDIDSLNYFNNFQQNHKNIEISGGQDSNLYQIERDTIQQMKAV